MCAHVADKNMLELLCSPSSHGAGSVSSHGAETLSSGFLSLIGPVCGWVSLLHILGCIRVNDATFTFLCLDQCITK